MNDYDNPNGDMDFDSDGDIDTDDELIGDLIFLEYLRNSEKFKPQFHSKRQHGVEVSPVVIITFVILVFLLPLIVCSSSM